MGNETKVIKCIICVFFVRLVGPLSYNNVCKLIMSVNRCVVKYDGDIVTAETIWIGRLNALGKFIRSNKEET